MGIISSILSFVSSVAKKAASAVNRVFGKKEDIPIIRISKPKKKKQKIEEKPKEQKVEKQEVEYYTSGYYASWKSKDGYNASIAIYITRKYQVSRADFERFLYSVLRKEKTLRWLTKENIIWNYGVEKNKQKTEEEVVVVRGQKTKRWVFMERILLSMFPRGLYAHLRFHLTVTG